MLKLLSDHAPAAWLAADAERYAYGWARTCVLGPAGYAAYARLRFIPDPAYQGQSEAEGGAHLPPDHAGERVQTQWAVQSLLPYTSTPTRGYLAFWTGWGSALADWLQNQPTFDIPAREYHIFRCSPADYASGAVTEYWRSQPGVLPARYSEDWLANMPWPAFIWPADRAWCIANDVDPHYAGIGASAAAIAAILADGRLDAVAADFDADQPRYAL